MKFAAIIATLCLLASAHAFRYDPSQSDDAKYSEECVTERMTKAREMVAKFPDQAVKCASGTKELHEKLMDAVVNLTKHAIRLRDAIEATDANAAWDLSSDFANMAQASSAIFDVVESNQGRTCADEYLREIDVMANVHEHCKV